MGRRRGRGEDVVDGFARCHRRWYRPLAVRAVETARIAVARHVAVRARGRGWSNASRARALGVAVRAARRRRRGRCRRPRARRQSSHDLMTIDHRRDKAIVIAISVVIYDRVQ